MLKKFLSNKLLFEASNYVTLGRINANEANECIKHTAATMSIKKKKKIRK